MSINIGARMGVRISNGIAIGPSIGVQLAGRGGGPKFLFRDDFLTDEAAPLASPRTAEPGPGALAIVDTNSWQVISGGALVVDSGETNTTSNDASIEASESFTRQAGLAALARVKVDAGRTVFGFFTASGGTTGSASMLPSSGEGGTRRVSAPADTNNSLYPGAVTGQYSEYAIVLRDTGALFFAKDSGVWRIIWVADTGSTSELWLRAFDVGIAPVEYSYDFLRALLLPAPFDTDYGLATDRLAGAVSAGQTFSHEADCIIEWTQTALPTSIDQNRLVFRFQDANNHWHARVTSAGNFELYERVGGSLTSRATAAGVVSAGHRCVVVCDGTTIRGYSNNVLQWTYSSATNFATATGGQFEATGSSTGTVSDLVTWPRTLPAAAASLLNKAVAS